MEGNYLRCYIVWRTALIAFAKVRLALGLIHKEGKDACALERSRAADCRLRSMPLHSLRLGPSDTPASHADSYID